MDKFLQTFLENNPKYEYIENLDSNTYKLKRTKSNNLFVMKALTKREKYPGNFDMFKKRFDDIFSNTANSVIETTDLGITSKQFYKISPYYENSLENKILNEYLTAGKSIALFYKLLDEVSNLHDNKTAHGNLKPSNIFLENEKILFSDFAFECEPKNSHYSITVKRESVSVNQDIFSLGVIFYEMLTWEKAKSGLELHPMIPGNIFTVIEKASVHLDKTYFKSAKDMIEYLKYALSKKMLITKTKNIPEISVETTPNPAVQKNDKMKAVLFYAILYSLVGLIILYLYFKNN